ncbi:MAG TPA: bacillithiol transferase BstA [Gemmatimonadaceae bacterium]|nr:bacillithiol transferase BstA [Gemmatimonadaceae bacterium]
MTAIDPRYPVGRFTRPAALSPGERNAAIDVLDRAPQDMRVAVFGLSDAQLDTPYRDGGWTVRQVVHHVPDSHMNAYVRCKLALTEDTPTIKPYDEAKWAELEDGRSPMVEESLSLLESLHARWVYLLRRLQPADFARLLTHPEWTTPMSIDVVLALYAWHSRHHTAHITELRRRNGW